MTSFHKDKSPCKNSTNLWKATQLLKSGDVQSLNDIYGEIEIIE